MDFLNGMKVAWGNLASFHRSMFYARRLLDGVLNHFAERWWDAKTISMFKLGQEIFSNCANLSSALVPSVKSNRSLKANTLSEGAIEKLFASVLHVYVA